MVSKNVVVVLCCLSFIVGFVTTPVALELASTNKPSYYLRPLEMAKAEAKCWNNGRLTGIGVKVSYDGVNYHAICENGKEIIWKK